MLKRIVIVIIAVVLIKMLAFSFIYGQQQVQSTQEDRNRLTYGQQLQFSQDDRDRLIRLETKVEALDQRIDDMNLRIDDLRGEMHDLKTFMLWGFGILFGAMGGLMAIVIWDRRTALSPVIRRNKQLEDRMETVFKEYAKVEPKFARILKAVGLM